MAQAVQAAPVPPQSLDAEESVLGAMMLSPGAIAAVSEILEDPDFYRESHSRIYRAALTLYAKGEPVDAITLVDELEERGELDGVGGRARIHELATLVPTTANAAHYARIIREPRRCADSSGPEVRSPGSAGKASGRPPSSSTGPSRSSSACPSSASAAISRTSKRC